MRRACSVVLFAGLLGADVAAAAVCAVSAVSFAFGAYDEFQAAHTDSTGHIAVTCHGAPGELVAYTVALNAGGGSLSQRRMLAANGSMLNYNLYTTAARVVVWGDGSSGSAIVSDAFSLRAGAVTRSYPVYGRVFALQKVPVGLYSDSIVATLNY